MGKTIIEKIWNAHVVTHLDEGPDVLYIDQHLIHEVTSPQAFAGLRKRNRTVFRRGQTWATADHNVPTQNQHLPIREAMSFIQVKTLEENCRDFGIQLFGLGHKNQGIVHVIAPELGITLPGMTLVCGDSHTSTHGGLGALAFGIGTSEVEQVFATQCVLQEKPQTMKIQIDGKLSAGVTAKDVILFIISQIGTSGATGCFVEFCGTTIRQMSIEERMTVCNMSIEFGARGGLVAPDETTFKYVEGKEFTPTGKKLEKAIGYWQTLFTDGDAMYDKYFQADVTGLAPQVTYGTNPGMGTDVGGIIPQQETASGKKALEYMGYQEGEKLGQKKINYVFIGSCTNSRIEDLRAAASLVNGKTKAEHVEAFVVPGSRRVMEQAIREGIDTIFRKAGFDFREPGCSACLGMNEDKIPSGSYCISTSNRNFEGRQGQGARTLLASPLTAAASALKGYVADPREYMNH
jgi:3-isopropylmalate/(R)-2-methylmalate dehydratase large subunit